MSVNGCNVPNYVQSEGNAKFRVNFKPREAAPHNLSVRFNGEPIPGTCLHQLVTPGSYTRYSLKQGTRLHCYSYHTRLLWYSHQVFTCTRYSHRITSTIYSLIPGTHLDLVLNSLHTNTVVTENVYRLNSNECSPFRKVTTVLTHHGLFFRLRKKN